MGGLHNVFISHRHQDDALVAELKELISSPRCRVRDFSVIAPLSLGALADEQIMAILAPRIARAGKVLVIVHPRTRFHRWVDWEIEHACTYRSKRIIGVWAPGASGCDLPGPLVRHANAVVEWDAEEVVAALEGRDNRLPHLSGSWCADR